MPPLVAAAAITGLAGAGTAAIGARASSNANKRSIEASDRAAARAEAAAREEDALNRADQERRDAEDKRRWEVEQANLQRRQEQDDQRLAYEDAIRYGKMVNLARLTGQPIPQAPPRVGAGTGGAYMEPARQASAPIMSRPSSANAAIAAPGAVSPFGDPNTVPQRMPISRLVGRREVI